MNPSLMYEMEKYHPKIFKKLSAYKNKFAFQYLDTIIVKGKSLPVRVYTPLPPQEADARQEELSLWEQAAGLYKTGDFTRAAEQLAELRRLCPDKLLYKIYAERADDLQKNPPGDWSGVWERHSK